MPTSSLRVVVFFGLFFWAGCRSDTPVTPPAKGRTPHDYTWTRDTLGDGTFQSSPSSIWGSSIGEVYVVGNASDQFARKMWRFDGLRWIDFTNDFFTVFSELWGYYWTPTDVAGYGPGDVWVVGLADTTPTPAARRIGFAMHRKPNGSWEGFRIPGAHNLYSVGGISSTDLWVGGIEGQMFHYDGSTWKEHQLPDSTMVNFIHAVSSEKVYVSGWVHPAGVEVVRYFEWNGTAWLKIEERRGSTFSPEAGVSFDILNEEIFSTNGPHISRRISQGVWRSMHYDPQAELYHVSNSGGHAFASYRTTVGSEALYHYDGSSWARIESLQSQNATLGPTWSTPTETFILGSQSNAEGTMFPKSWIVRGK